MSVVSKSTYIDVNIDEFTDDEIVREVEQRNLYMKISLDQATDEDIIDEFFGRGLNIINGNDPDEMLDELHELRNIYLTMSPEFFKKRLEDFLDI